ncbi:ARP8 [Candida oxycetoniae]|uniref:ARP8 n=1 Tax=Candida oxycetoniae TaxID=497107 RepID=A0AAI9WYB9_9ASCO|nr:ARP8 [Candida oxycetoniae]KAI3404681.2 ARP8 [Candida oxycetoniae]
MSDPINPPTSPYMESDALTPLPSSQIDPNNDGPATTEEPTPQPTSEEPETKKPKLAPKPTATTARAASSSAAGTAGGSTGTGTGTGTGSAPKKSSAEALRRRRENRQRAAAALAQNLKNSGVGRFEQENGFGLTAVQPIPLINQKNYYTEYLKKDEQVGFIRNWRLERDLQNKLRKLKQNGEIDKLEEVKNFNDFDLNNIENELKKKTEVDDEDVEEEEEEETEELRQEKAKIGEDVIVLQPGSAYIRLGRATDAVPIVIPNVIAVRKRTKTEKTILPHREVDEDRIVLNNEFDEQRSIVSKDFRARMRYYKRRILPNSRETVANYNRKQEPEKIPDHNDPDRKEWIKPDSRKFYTGEDALQLVLNDEWCLRYPMINGNFNEYSKDYESRQEILGDLTNIIQSALKGVDVANMKVMLLIPDLYDKTYVEAWCELLLKFIGFGKIGIIQEAVAATFGAGASTTCIVDVGAQTTKVSCVDEGMIISDSRILLNYGGDNITETFIKLALENWFPYRDINLSNSYDWKLAMSLKKNFATFQDADIAIQLYNFYKRNPYQLTEKFEFKVFDEVMLAPMGLFFPDLFQEPPSSPAFHSSTKPTNMTMKHLFPKSLDQYNSKSNNPRSKSQDKLKTNLNYCDVDEMGLLMRLVDDSAEANNTPLKIPLEKAIVESITNASLSDPTKMKKYYDNILVVGGGLAKIDGYDLILADRINIWRPKYLSTTAFGSIIEYLNSEIKNSTLKKQQMIEEAKGDEQELAQEVFDKIDAECELQLDLDHVDELNEEGSLIPINILPTPREFDPSMLTWKGGSVYSRLKVVNEMWITQKDWDLLGSRSLYYKSIFNY